MKHYFYFVVHLHGVGGADHFLVRCEQNNRAAASQVFLSEWKLEEGETITCEPATVTQIANMMDWEHNYVHPTDAW